MTRKRRYRQLKFARRAVAQRAVTQDQSSVGRHAQGSTSPRRATADSDQRRARSAERLISLGVGIITCHLRRWNIYHRVPRFLCWLKESPINQKIRAPERRYAPMRRTLLKPDIIGTGQLIPHMPTLTMFHQPSAISLARCDTCFSRGEVVSTFRLSRSRFSLSHSAPKLALSSRREEGPPRCHFRQHP